MSCCKCNRTGRCRNCSCVKAGRPCQGCLPQRLGNCSNVTSIPVPDQSAPTVQLNPPPTSSESQSPSAGTSEPLAPPAISPMSDGEHPNCDVSWPETALQPPTFMWGPYQGADFCTLINTAYDEVVQWRRNLFQVPSGSSGKAFVLELARLFQAYADSSSLECIAMKATTIAQALLLQKPSRTSKSKDHAAHLQRRLDLWHGGDIRSLLEEGRCIQKRLCHGARQSNDEMIARTFRDLMMQGEVRNALRYLSRNTSGGVLKLDDMVPDTLHNGETVSRSTRDILLDKHPLGKDPTAGSLLNHDSEPINPIMFDSLNADAIHQAALHTQGSAGPSGLDAHAWRRLCSSFKSASHNLCSALSNVAKRIATTHVNPEGLSAFVACRLIPLDKCPGVRPIGVGEVPRRIIAKAILRIVGSDVEEAAGPLQVCAGQDGGCEAAVHAMRSVFQAPETEAVLLVDATNAFNSINRKAALHNINVLCPPLAHVLINTYRVPVRLFITGGGEIASTEGTTQGDPLAMAMYALAVTPLIDELRSRCPDVHQVWYADDATGASTCRNLRAWWNGLADLGPTFGYHPNASKTYLVVKEEHETCATQLFADTNVHITTHGKRHLGAALGSKTFTEEYVSAKVLGWTKEIEYLAKVAVSQPHAAYAAFTHGLSSRWTYLLRTIPDIQDLLLPLENAIHQSLIPALTGRPPCSTLERDLLALPIRLGGLGLYNPAAIAPTTFQASQHLTAPLVAMIIAQEVNQTIDPDSISAIKKNIRKSNRQRQVQLAVNVYDQLPPQLKRCVDLAKEKGSSSWLSVLPLEDHGFYLHKGEFRDALCLRYGWQLGSTPLTCSCGAQFSVDHAMVCHMGGFPTIRHNEIRDITGSLLTEVCRNVAIEPPLQPLSGETLEARSANTDDGARLDIRARGFWNAAQDAFFDVRVFYPNASSNRSTATSSAYRRHEQAKKRQYGQRVREVEHGVFTPLVFSSTGGMGREAITFYKRLADMLSQKRQHPYPTVMGWLRCRLSFASLRSSIMCIRGSRSPLHRPSYGTDITLAASEGRVPAL